MISKIKLRQTMRGGRFFILMLALIFTAAACGKQKVADAGSQFEANLMFDILHSSNLHVVITPPPESAEVKTWEVSVDEGWFGGDEHGAAILLLRDCGLPRPLEPEIKTTDSFGMASERAEKERQRRDLQHSIERQLYDLPDVIRASVVIAQPVDDVLSLEKTPPSASVLLILKETQPKFTIEAVQNQVAAAAEKMKPENVKVLISQQSLREIPLEKLAAQRRSNQIFAIGGGAVLFLFLALGAVIYMSKRRKQIPENHDAEQLKGGDDYEEFEGYERPLLGGESDDE